MKNIIITNLIIVLSVFIVKAQTPGVMDFGSTSNVLAFDTFPFVDQLADTRLNGFNVSADSFGEVEISFADEDFSMSMSGVGAISLSNTDMALTWIDAFSNSITSGTLATATGNEVRLITMEFAFAFNDGTGFEDQNFSFVGRKDGAIVGTLDVNFIFENTATFVDFTMPTTGSFNEIDELVILPETPIVGGWSIDDLEVANTDNTSPSISSVNSSVADGIYNPGQSIPIQVIFSEAVVVLGVPQLTLETGDIDRNASYLSGSGTNILVFDYEIQPGDISADLDYISTGALSLNGGTVTDSAQNNAILNLPTPGTSGSLGANKSISIIDPTLSNTDFEINKVSLMFYPNPVEETLTMTSSYQVLDIYDLNGKKVLQKASTSDSIDISNLVSGVYILVVTTKEVTITKKLIKA